MSGVTGAQRIASRFDYEKIIADYKKILTKFPYFENYTSTGSYNSDLDKNSFGDIDLIVLIRSTNSKKQVKKQLQDFLESLPTDIIVPFSSIKHVGKRSYNSGEIITVRFYSSSVGYSVQIDNIVALTLDELTFKRNFLDWDAAKQGLILGLVKIAVNEQSIESLCKKLEISINCIDRLGLGSDQEYEFNLSSTELQLRKVEIDPISYKQKSCSVLWTSNDTEKLYRLLDTYDLSLPFEQLCIQSKHRIKNSRSPRRIIGLFSSMVSVKSGEINTSKGRSKELSIDFINKTFA